MKAKLILFVTALFIFNAVVVAQTKKQKVKNTSQANNANSSQGNNAKAANGNTNFIDSTFIKSPKANVKQPAGKARVKQGNN